MRCGLRRGRVAAAAGGHLGRTCGSEDDGRMAHGWEGRAGGRPVLSAAVAGIPVEEAGERVCPAAVGGVSWSRGGRDEGKEIMKKIENVWGPPTVGV